MTQPPTPTTAHGRLRLALDGWCAISREDVRALLEWSGKADAALTPLKVIADAFDANELDDEARRFWGPALEYTVDKPYDRIELYAGRGGRRLLTLADALQARAVMDARP